MPPCFLGKLFVPDPLCSISHFQVKFSMLNWHFFFTSQFLCLYFSSSFLPMGILLIPPSILEACSQIPFQASFDRLFLFQSAEGGHVPHPITHPRCSSLYLFLFQFIFPEHGSAEFALVFRTRSWCAADTLPASAGNPSWEEGVILAFSWLCCI